MRVVQIRLIMKIVIIGENSFVVIRYWPTKVVLKQLRISSTNSVIGTHTTDAVVHISNCTTVQIAVIRGTCLEVQWFLSSAHQEHQRCPCNEISANWTHTFEAAYQLALNRS